MAKQTKTLTDKSMMKTAFIRVSEKNNTNEGLVSYTLDDIKKKVEDLAFRYTALQYAYITHDKDFNDDGPVSKHYHIVLWFKNKNSIRFKTLKEVFPFGSIQTCESVNACVQYLIHKNNEEKFQYNKDEIFSNVESQDEFDALFINDGKLQKRLKTQNENEIIDEIVEKISTGEIRRFNYDKYIDGIMYSKYAPRIDRAFKYQDQIFFGNPDRNISVIFITGKQGKGKTEFAKKAFISDDMNGFGVSSSSNDPFQDYNDEDIFIFDDLRDDAYSFVDFLKIIDPRTNSSVKSRNRNKYFKGKLLIITSFDPLENWYSSKVPKDARKQLYRRIDKYIVCDDDFITIYDIDENLTKSNPHRIVNPIPYLKKQEDKEKGLNIDGVFERFVSTVSEKLTPENFEEYHFTEEKRKFDEELERKIDEYFGYSENTEEELPF